MPLHAIGLKFGVYLIFPRLADKTKMEFLAIPSLHDNRSTEIFFNASNAWEGKPHSRLGHACQLDIDQIAEFPRQTGIACTLGMSNVFS